MRLHRLAGRLAASLVLVLLASSPVAAQLIGLSHDRASADTTAAQIDDQLGLIVPIGGGNGPVTIGWHAVAYDPLGGALHALGPDPVAGDGSLGLWRFDLDDGSLAFTGNLGTSESIAGIGWSLEQGTLLAALVDPVSGSLRLVAIDALSAALTERVAPIIDCCELAPGVVAIDSDSLLLVGRRASDPPGSRFLIRLAVDGSGVSEFQPLTRPLAAIGWDRPADRLYGMSQTPASPAEVSSVELLEIAADGSLSTIGSATPDCCRLAPGIGAVVSSTGRWHLLGAAPADDLAIVSVELGSGTISFSPPLPAANTINAMFDALAGLTPTATTIDSITPSPVTIGQSYLVSASVNASVTVDAGQIMINDGLGNSCVIAVPGGSCSLPATQVGPVTVEASYSGSIDFLPSSATALQEIVRAASSSVIDDISPSPSRVGQAYTVSASVSGFGTPSGVIDIDDGLGESCQIVLPANSCMLNAGSVGPRTITASYAGDINNLPSSDGAAHEVLRALSTVSIDSVVPDPATVGQPYEVNVSVTGFGTPTGLIAVSDGAGARCQITLPAASCSLTSTSAGKRTLLASYSGDGLNEGGSASRPLTVERAVSSISIVSIAPTPVNAGQPWQVEVAVAGFGTPLGTVDVSDDSGAGCTISLPDTGCSLVSNVAGNRVVTAAYSGDVNNLPGNDVGNQLVEPAITSLQLQTSATQVLYDVPVDLLATVVDGAAPVTGSIAFSIEGVLIPGCENVVVAAATASCLFTPDFIGVRVVRAEYGGDANNLPAAAEFQLGVQPLAIPALSLTGLVVLLLLLSLIALRHRSLRA
jgi:hypothetical protein